MPLRDSFEKAGRWATVATASAAAALTGGDEAGAKTVDRSGKQEILTSSRQTDEDRAGHSEHIRRMLDPIGCRMDELSALRDKLQDHLQKSIAKRDELLRKDPNFKCVKPEELDIKVFEQVFDRIEKEKPEEVEYKKVDGGLQMNAHPLHVYLLMEMKKLNLEEDDPRLKEMMETGNMQLQILFINQQLQRIDGELQRLNQMRINQFQQWQYQRHQDNKDNSQDKPQEDGDSGATEATVWVTENWQDYDAPQISA